MKQRISHRQEVRALWKLAGAVILICLLYLFYQAHFDQPSLFLYILSLRLPTLICMGIAAVAIGAATLIFQSIVNNQIVTPALLGMSAIYSFLHTAAVFVFGTGSLLFLNANFAFLLDLVLMGSIGVLLYWHLFKKSGHNILYIMLIGTVLSSLFGSAQSAMIRVMDPNEYDALHMSLTADFNQVNGEIIGLSILALIVIGFVLRKDLSKLDIIALGRDQAINLGVDYDTVIRHLLSGVVLCMATATAAIGPVSFLGLIAANLARNLMKTYRHRHLIAASALIAMLALAGGQMLSQHLFHFSVPVSVFVTIAGGIYFLYLLLRRKGAY